MSTTASAENSGQEILLPDLPIIDSHFHLFDLPHIRYMLDEYLADAQGGHNVIASVYSETRAFIRTDGPEVMRPLGEVEFANGIAAMTAGGRYGNCKVAAAIVGHADLTHGHAVGELLDKSMAAAPDRYRGIRHVTLDYPDERPFQFIMSGRPPSGVLDNPNFVKGLAELDKRSLIFDAAIYDPSLPAITALADQFPDLQIVLNNMGGLVLVDMTPEEKAAAITRWKGNLTELAKRPNVACKLGGLGMPTWGFDFIQRPDEATYQELAAVWQPFVESVIEIFGVERCMYGSNFPPDKRSSGYVKALNAYKYILRGYSETEQQQLFAGTAKAIYKID
ncbi:amidohydrolase family protein [Alteromonas lipolytica]|uniref:Amidohydrolase n=1 Tax=Alteromonas lipolytica TaxID=1856405 RepID=A0A1E8FIF1_9ALTE|nr:amidohydrolase family protein [Alteromonas lipolytica]OFI35711.1 amidohydrolase [Alteromonas lipolytica]GGF78058.1 hypothetical protein GCM10011338_33050 [Alteromonas lipolytica]